MRPWSMELWDADGWASSIYERAGLDPDEPVAPSRLARAILGADAVRIVPHGSFAQDGYLARVHERWIICVRKGLSRERLRFVIAHELAEYTLRDVIDERVEDACNAVAAALLAPRRPFLSRVRAVGHDWAQLALPFGMTETSAALRAGEAEGLPLAVVAKIVRTRGPDEFVWPAESTLRAWARRPPPGLAKATLRDDPKRVVLLAEQLDAELAV